MKRSILFLSNLKLSNFCNHNSSILKRTITSKKSKERPHEYYKWGYKPLPTQTVLDEDTENLHFAVRPPAFKLPNPKGRLSRREWRNRIAELHEARNCPELEKSARNRQLFLPLDEIDVEWKKEFGLFDLKNAAKYYGLQHDLFNDNDIIFKTWLEVAFNDVKIHRGNIVEPKQLLDQPSSIIYDADGNSLHTLILTNIDGHPLNSSKELIHWMVCNIKGTDVSSGDTVFEYLPPTPWKGTGFHRLAFVLCQQSNVIDMEKHSSTINGRTFSTPSFLSLFSCEPLSSAWCQVKWDESVTQTSKKIQDISEEPIFDWEEYIDPKKEQIILKKEMREMKYRNM